MVEREYDRQTSQQIKDEFTDLMFAFGDTLSYFSDEVKAVTGGIEAGEINFSVDELVELRFLSLCAVELSKELQSLVHTQSKKYVMHGSIGPLQQESQDE